MLTNKVALVTDAQRIGRAWDEDAVAHYRTV